MKRHPIALFLLLTLLISSVFYYLIVRSGHMGGGWGAYVAGLMWSPGFAGLLTCKLLGRDLKTIGWSWGSGRYETIAYLIPLGYSLAIYGFVWITGIGTFFDHAFVAKVAESYGLGPLPNWLTLVLYFLFTATYSVIRDTATVIGEEIGWRGFLVPELAKTRGFAATAAITGLIWAVWHYPVVLFADYRSDTPVWFYLPLLTVMLPLITFVWTWLRLKSGSIWPCVILHASHNTFMQTFFDPITLHNKKTNYVANEFGAGMLFASIVLAYYFWRRRGEVEGPGLVASMNTGMTRHFGR